MTENRENMSIKYAVCVLEAIGNGLTLSNENDREDACVLAIQALEEIQAYRAIGTIDEFKALKKKIGASKKVVAISLTHEGRVGNCPNCNNFVAEKYDKKCPKCRLKLDWQ